MASQDQLDRGERQEAPTKAAKPAFQGASSHKDMGRALWIVIAAVCLVAGLAIGHFAIPRGGSALNKASLQESELDTPVATYVYDGKSYDVTARDVITQSSSLDSYKSDDGTYKTPSADNAIDVARNQIMQKVIEDQGITVSDDEAKQYASTYLGTDDYSTIASNYNMDEDSVENLVKQSCAMRKLRDTVVTEQVPDQPAAPSQPADGQEDTPTQDYATYIINLAGDEWDSSTGTWASSDSDYAQALADYQVTSDSATYAAAQAAYYVAYQKYATAQQDVSNQWTNYVNNILANASIQVYTLTA